VSDPPEAPYARSAVTAVRLGGALALLALLYAALRIADGARFATMLGDATAEVPRWLVSGIVAACQLGFLVPAVLGLLSQIALQRFGRVGRMLLAAVLSVGGLVLMASLVGRSVLPLLPPRDGSTAGSSGYGIGAAFPTTMDLGVITAWISVDRAHWTERWRRVGRIVLAAGVLARLGVSLAHPATIATAVVMGVAASLVVQLLLGARNTRPRAVTVGQILGRFGYAVTSVERFGGFRGFAGFRVTLADDRQQFVKIVSRDSWTALLPVRVYRTLRFRDVGPSRPLQTLRTVVEHEALCALKAHADGVPTPRLAVISEFPPDSMMVAFDAHAFRSLRELAPEERTPGLLAAVWAIVAALQQSRTVHRRLNADALLVDDDGGVAVVEFGSASLGVVGPALSTDVAEVLAATAPTLGVGRAVEAAIAGVGRDAVAAALPRLQPLALTHPTRDALEAAGCLDDLRREVQRATGADPTPIASLERIKVGTVVTIATVAVALWTLVPQIVGVGSLWGEVRHANLWWAGAALVLSGLTYVAAAVAFDGAVPEPLPLGPNIGMQMATALVGVATPVGSLGIAARFLQKRGIDRATSIAAVGANAVAGVIVHISLIGMFAVLAGSSGLGTFGLPSARTLGLIAAGIVAVAVAGTAVPWSRSVLTGHLLPAMRRSLASLGEIAHQPSKMIELFGGSLGVTMGYVLMLEVSAAAFGPGPAFTSVALVYLVGSAVASVAPTPGGLGAAEATLIAGLTSAGMASTTAIGAVLLYRLASFWIPILPGWAALVVLQRSDDL
jgi:uncharacterized membrane protein YbhN (UPF0104 family)